MIMSAFSREACSPAAPLPLGFHFQACPALPVNAFTPPFFNLISQSIRFVYESAQALAYTCIHLCSPQLKPGGVSSWAHSPRFPWLLCCSPALLQLVCTLFSCPDNVQTVRVQVLSSDRFGFTSHLNFVSLDFLAWKIRVIIMVPNR